MPTKTPTRTRKVTFTVNSVRMASPPRPRPTPTAAGRLRPVRRSRFSGCAGSAGLSAGRSDLKQFRFFMFEQLVHLRDIGVREVLEFPLRPAPLVFASVAGLDQLVQRVLGVPPDVADGDLALLGLAVGDLDVLPAPLLGQFGEDNPDDRAVV